MNRDALQPWQAAKVLRTLRPTLGYLHRLRERMERTGFPPQDALYLRVFKAYDALHALCVDLHYLSCDGVGRPSRKRPPR